MNIGCLFVEVVILFSPFLYANSIKTSLPLDVLDIVDRKAGCGHWAGEYGYDDERKKEIAKALKDLKCDKFESDLKKIQKKYKNRKDILKAIEEASADG